MENLEFRPVRKTKRVLEEVKAKQILKDCEYGVIAVIGDNNYPHAIPINYAYVNNKIYFHSAKQGHKVDSIEKNNKVAFTVVGYHKVLPEKFDSEYESVVVHGKAFECFDNEKEAGLFSLIEKYSKGFEISGQEYIDRAKNAVKVYKIEIDHLTGKSSK